jgi:hypothetical protein
VFPKLEKEEEEVSERLALFFHHHHHPLSFNVTCHDSQDPTHTLSSLDFSVAISLHSARRLNIGKKRFAELFILATSESR